MSGADWTAWALVVLAVVLIVLWLVWVKASRLDRLHRRVIDSRATLDAQLVRRASAAWDLATADVLDPVSGVLVAAAARESLLHTSGGEPGQVPHGPDQAMVESELSAVLREALGGPAERAQLASVEGATELLAELDQSWYRVQLARRFYNDAVVQVRRIRAKGYVRLFRLAGKATLPQTFEMDDAGLG